MIIMNAIKFLLVLSVIIFSPIISLSQGNGNNGNGNGQNPHNISSGSSSFIKNNGQLIGTDGNPRPDILYYTSAGGADIFFTKDAACFVWSRIDTGNAAPDTLYRMDMRFLGFNPMVQVTTKDTSQDFTNFYLSHIPNGILNVHSYQKLIYKDIYPNIDLVFNNDSRGLNFNFIVHKVAIIKISVLNIMVQIRCLLHKKVAYVQKHREKGLSKSRLWWNAKIKNNV